MADATAYSDPESPEWRRPRPPLDSTDLVIGVGLFAAGLLSWWLATSILGERDPSALPAVLVLAGLTLPLVLRRRYPIPVGLFVAAVSVVFGELEIPEVVVSQIAMFMSVYVIGAWEQNRRWALWARVAIIAGMAVWLLIVFLRLAANPGEGPVGVLAEQIGLTVLINAMYFAGAFWFGEHSWRAAAQRAVVAARNAQLQADRHRLARQAVTIERMRVARELHDAVAHHVSLMGVQAAAARTVLTSDPERAEAILEQLEQSARSAVAELYGLLDALREDDQVVPAPPVGIEQLRELVDEAKSAGVTAQLHHVGNPRAVSPELSLTLYRVTQEALTNVVKHSGPGTDVQVLLRWGPDRIELEIADDGLGRHRTAGSAGMGQRNMKERVTALRGQWESGPRVDSGYLVRATFEVAR